MGRQGNFELEFTGAASGDAMNVTANLVGQPAMKMTARLTKKSGLVCESSRCLSQRYCFAGQRLFSWRIFALMRQR
jgi:hypothetical protein